MECSEHLRLKSQSIYTGTILYRQKFANQTPSTLHVFTHSIISSLVLVAFSLIFFQLYSQAGSNAIDEIEVRRDQVHIQDLTVA